MGARRVGPGSIVDVVAPAGPFDEAGFRQGVELLRAQGLVPRFRDDIFARDRFLAGGDERRLGELVAALESDSDLLWSARGGYGVTRIVERVPLELIRRANKAFVGFSDLTVMHLQWLRAGVPTIHGSMVARLSAEPAHVQARLFGLALSGRPPPALHGRPVVAGAAEGLLTGGNLVMLSATCGTPFQPDLRGKLLFLEDVGERPYRLDRMLIQCRQAGLFEGVAGLAFGEFSGCDEKDGSASSAQVLDEHAQRLGVPTIAELPCGHGKINEAMPFGVRARLDATGGGLVFLEPIFGEANA